MPIYEFKCEKCGVIQDVYRKVVERDNDSICPRCENKQKRLISKLTTRVFEPQTVGATLTDKDGNDINPYVRNKQELTDAINKYNDTERASKTGKVAILE